MPNVRTHTKNHVVTLRPKFDTWQELFIMADSEMRSLPSAALAIIHAEFVKRYPQGLSGFIKENPDFVFEDRK